MTNRLRYAWGNSPFGDFIVAKIGNELVAFEYPLSTEDAVAALCRRFPGCVAEEDREGLESTLADCSRFVNHPDRSPAGASVAHQLAKRSI